MFSLHFHWISRNFILLERNKIYIDNIEMGWQKLQRSLRTRKTNSINIDHLKTSKKMISSKTWGHWWTRAIVQLIVAFWKGTLPANLNSEKQDKQHNKNHLKREPQINFRRKIPRFIDTQQSPRYEDLRIKLLFRRKHHDIVHFKERLETRGISVCYCSRVSKRRTEMWIWGKIKKRKSWEDIWKKSL